MVINVADPSILTFFGPLELRSRIFFFRILDPIVIITGSVADPNPVGSGPFWSDPDVWDRIRILALINDPISTFWCVKNP
jgi:hypothetical protein